MSRLTLESALSAEEHDYSVAALHLGGPDFYCTMHPFRGAAQFREAAHRLLEQISTTSLPALLRLMREEFGPDEFGLDDLLPGGRRAMCRIVYGDLLNDLSAQFAHLLGEFERVAQILERGGIE